MSPSSRAPDSRPTDAEDRNGNQVHPAGEVHPEAHELVAFHDGSLEEERAGAVGRHLEDCPECTGLLEDLDDLAGLLDGGRSELGPKAVAAARDRLPVPRPRTAVGPEGGTVGPPGPEVVPQGPAVVPPWGRRPALRPLLAVAAVLLVALGTVSLLGLEQRREAEALRNQLAALQEPMGGGAGAIRERSPDRAWSHALVLLGAPDRVLRSDGAPPTVTVDPEDRALVFVLPLADVETSGPYRVKLLRAGEGDEEQVWEGRVGRREEGGQVTFSLASAGLGAGPYRVELATADGRVLGEYPFRLHRPRWNRPEGP